MFFMTGAGCVTIGAHLWGCATAALEYRFLIRVLNG